MDWTRETEAGLTRGLDLGRMSTCLSIESIGDKSGQVCLSLCPSSDNSAGLRGTWSQPTYSPDLVHVWSSFSAASVHLVQFSSVFVQN